jgi:hypothetical protein
MPRPSKTRGAVTLVAALGASVAHADRAALSWLGPATGTKNHAAARGRENARCEGCHVEQAEQWRRSLHRAAYDDPVFQRAYTLEPLAFCRGCHAPEAPPSAPPAAELGALGVACTTCHLDPRGVVTAVHVSGRAPHPVQSEPALGTRAACARCHQFDFPTLPGVTMQSTLDEHARSTSSARECQSCHMPLDGKRRRRHDFSVLAAPDFLRSAVRVSAERWDGHSIQLELTPANIAHAFPTGDLFRRLELRACVSLPDSESCAAPVHLGRSYRVQLTPHGTLRIPVADTRVAAPGAAPPSRVRLVFDVDIQGLPIRWSVSYQRADEAMAKLLGLDPEVDAISVASGVLSAGAESAKH